MQHDTDTYAIFGNPLEHSLSPLMHNAAFAETGERARYISRQVDGPGEAAREIRESGMKGASITIPFKTSIMGFLDEISEDARRIGAVNTVVNRGGALLGANTDWSGFIMDMEDAGLAIKGKQVAVAGAGGAARAVVFGLVREGATPVVFNRDSARGERLARDFGCDFLPLGEIGKAGGDVLVNTTPVGMHPRVDETILSRAALRRFEWVVDLIYNPLRTRLLREAELEGCRVRSGLGMLVRQGAEQFRLWTGKEPPLALMRRVVEDELVGENVTSRK